VSGLLISLPSAVPKRSQKIRKSPFLDKMRESRNNYQMAIDTLATIAKGWYGNGNRRIGDLAGWIGLIDGFRSQDAETRRSSPRVPPIVKKLSSFPKVNNSSNSNGLSFTLLGQVLDEREVDEEGQEVDEEADRSDIKLQPSSEEPEEPNWDQEDDIQED
jgi:hypothetical protein